MKSKKRNAVKSQQNESPLVSNFKPTIHTAMQKMNFNKIVEFLIQKNNKEIAHK